MNPFLVGWTTARRRRGTDHGPERPPRAGTLRLLALEAGWLAGQVARPSRSVPALAVGATVGVLLAPVTPGPVVTGGWSAAIAVSTGMLAAVVAHVLLQRRGEESGTSTPLVGAAVVALFVSITLLLGHLLTALSPGTVATGSLPGGGLAIDPLVALGAVLLLLGVLATRLGDRLRVPGALALLFVGMVVGSDGLGWAVVDDPQLVQAIAVVALVVILFEGGLTTRPRSLRGAVVPGVVLATIGVAVTTAVLAVVGASLLGLDGGTALLVAAVLAPTDAAAVFAVLRRTPLPQRLAGVLQVESGTNDPVAVLLTVVVLTSAGAGSDPATWIGFVVAQLGIGAALGIAAGFVGAWLVSGPAGAGGLLPVLALAIGGATYGVTAVAGGSGFLAVYLCGVVMAARTPSARRTLRSFHESLASSVEVGLFLLLGLLVFPAGLPDVVGAGVALTLVLLFVARPAAVAASLAPFGFSPRELAAVSWLGMRGAVPVVLATVAFSTGSAVAPFLFDVVFVVVLLSLLVQGVTAGPLVDRLGLARPSTPADVVMDASPFEGLDAELLDVVVLPTGPLAGRTLAAAPPPDGVLVTAIVREGHLLVPRGTTKLRPGDHLVVASDRPDATPAVRDWAGPVTTDPVELP